MGVNMSICVTIHLFTPETALRAPAIGEVPHEIMKISAFAQRAALPRCCEPPCNRTLSCVVWLGRGAATAWALGQTAVRDSYNRHRSRGDVGTTTPYGTGTLLTPSHCDMIITQVACERAASDPQRASCCPGPAELCSSEVTTPLVPISNKINASGSVKVTRTCAHLCHSRCI